MSVLQRIGVFVCHCGSNIAATVDVKKVVEVIKNEPGVVHAEDYPYMCSEAGQSLIAKAIKEENLTGIVVCSCSPRMHELNDESARALDRKIGIDKHTQPDGGRRLLARRKIGGYIVPYLASDEGDRARVRLF